MSSSHKNISLYNTASERILVLDGALGTMIQALNLEEKDFRGDSFSNHKVPLKGCNDVLALTSPEAIAQIHRQYLQAGADIISTDSFNANAISLADYCLEGYVAEINKAAANVARKAADDFMAENPRRHVWVAGSVGPSGWSLTMAAELGAPEKGSQAWDTMVETYLTQIRALIEGGVDILLIETQFDALNTRAILFAAQEAMEATGKEIPVIVSATLTQSGRLLSGHTLKSFSIITKHIKPFAIGLNCGFGADDMAQHLPMLADSPCLLSVYPNAGLPDELGRYSDTPELMAEKVRRMLDSQPVNIVGGCCGTTPEHIRLIAEVAKDFSPRTVPAANNETLCLAGLEPLEVGCDAHSLVKVGERCNVAGSRKFLRLLSENNIDECERIAAEQVERGAAIVDINTDDPLLDASDAMQTLLLRFNTSPDVAKAPIMIDTSHAEVMTTALKCVSGRAVVNSISLKEGEEAFVKKAKYIRKMGAAVVVMAFDEQGQATDYQRRIEICQRAYKLLTEEAGFDCGDIIFDPNILTIATGIAEHDNYAVDFLCATEWIKHNLKGAKVSGGVSNLSFAFRGNETVRRAMHSVFLDKAVANGLDMAIVNVATMPSVESIEQNLRDAVEAAILNKGANAADILVEMATEIAAAKAAAKASTTPLKADAGKETPHESDSLESLVIKGTNNGLPQALNAALAKCGNAYSVIQGPLMQAMSVVGEKFGRGEMFLPQVVKSATVMKQAVDILQPIIESENKSDNDTSNANTIVLATVKGDVHDIGKNIVATVLACNGWHVIDMGVMVPGEDIVAKAIETNASCIGLSGLITPSLDEMMQVASLMQSKGLSIPLFVGGAAASELHTALKIAPRYSGTVVYTTDAASLPPALSRFTGDESERYRTELQATQQSLAQTITTGEKNYAGIYTARKSKPTLTEYNSPTPKALGITDISIPVSKIEPLINWRALTTAWKVNPKPKACSCCKDDSHKHLNNTRESLLHDAKELLLTLEDEEILARVALYPADADNTDNIIIHTADGDISLPMLRRQVAPYSSLADYVEGYLGLFTVTIPSNIAKRIKDLHDNGNEYGSLLLQSLADRLVEAATELVHYKVRSGLWGFSTEEQKPNAPLKDADYQGIRPAFGYPSLPDQSLVHVADKILDYKSLGIEITQNGALWPTATTTGLIFDHPDSHYFPIGNIAKDQAEEYCRRRGIDQQQLIHFLPNTLIK